MVFSAPLRLCGESFDLVVMKVFEAVANAFVKEGATTVFGLMGDGNMSWAAAMTAKPGEIGRAHV